MGKFVRSLFGQVVIALILGITLGWAYPSFAVALKPLGDGFIKLIKMVIAPLVFGVVVHGIVGAGDLRKVGRVGVKAIVYFEVLTTIALVLGVVLAYVVRPGVGMNIDPKTLDASALSAYTSHVAQVTNEVDVIMRIIPSTIVDAFAQGDILQVLLVAILFGVGLALLGERGRTVTHVIEETVDVLFKVIGFIVKLAPLGVLGAVAFTVGKYGVASLGRLGLLVALYYVAAALFVLVVLGVVLRLAGFSIFKLLRYLREELLIVFGTASSDAVLPQVMRKLEGMGIKNSTVGLVIPMGYSFNLDGFSIYLTLAAVFIAQATNTPLSTGRSADGARGRVAHLQGRERRAGIGDRRAGRDALGDTGDPGDRPRAGAVGGLVHGHRARGLEPDRQLRRHRSDRGLGGRHRPGAGEAGAGRARVHRGVCLPSRWRRRRSRPPLGW